MKIAKNILLVFAGIVVLILVLAAIFPSEFGVVREVTINKPNTEVFQYTKYLKNQEKFSVWAKIDPNMTREFTGVDGTVGFVSAWRSNHPDVGIGEQEIVKIDGEKRIDYELRFFEPFESSSLAYMIFDKLDLNKTVVKWGFDGEMPYPMNLMLLFMDMDAELGKDLQDGLDNLKEILENQ